MSFNLLEMVKDYFTSDIVNQASSKLGENSAGISKALSGIIPAGLAGILNKATSGSEGANSLFNMAKDAIGSISSPANFNTPSSQSSSFLSGIFGGGLSGLTSMISKFAGIKDSSASSLISMGLPAILGLLGKHAEENNMSASGLSGFLSSQKDNIMSAMPAGLSLPGLPGVESLGNAASSVASDLKSSVVNSTEELQKSTGGGTKWLWPLIIILAAIALIWYLMRGCNKSTDTISPSTDTSASVITRDSATASIAPSSGTESIKVKLPDGKELDALKGGIEDQLVTFLSGDWKSLSEDSLKTRWFEFDNLNFDLGKATIVATSEKQLDNISEILKAFPDAKIKIGGYTDASGNAASNKKLSQDRADAAKAGLEKRGVGAQVTGAEGYGSEFAKFPATAPESDRATDRHISVSVRK